MGTQKWHLLDHLVDAIRHVGGLKFLHGGLYEGSHKIFKSVYAKGSHRRRSAMDDAVSRFNKKLHNDYLSSRKGEQQTRQNHCKVYAMSQDSGMMVSSGVKTSLADLKSLLPLLLRRKEAAEIIVDESNTFHSNMLKLGQGCLRSLCRLLDEHLRVLCKDAGTARHIKIIFPVSAYISGIPAPTLESTAEEDTASFESSSLRLLQRLVAGERFYGSMKGRFDAVLFVREASMTSGGSEIIKHSCCFAKVLRLVRTLDRIPIFSCCQGHGQPRCVICYLKPENELYFVQWYEILDKKKVPLDKIDLILNCIRLQLERTPGEEKVLSANRNLELDPLESVRGVVQVVPKEPRFSTAELYQNQKPMRNKSPEEDAS